MSNSSNTIVCRHPDLLLLKLSLLLSVSAGRARDSQSVGPSFGERIARSDGRPHRVHDTALGLPSSKRQYAVVRSYGPADTFQTAGRHGVAARVKPIGRHATDGGPRVYAGKRVVSDDQKGRGAVVDIRRAVQTGKRTRDARGQVFYISHNSIIRSRKHFGSGVPVLFDSHDCCFSRTIGSPRWRICERICLPVICYCFYVENTVWYCECA